MSTPASVSPRWTAAADWPRTTRVLPWSAAALIATVFLVPIDSITLPINLPFDARPDRVLLAGCFLIWALVVALSPRGSRTSHYRFGAVEALLLTFVAVSVLSVAFNVRTLTILNEADGASKRLIFLLSLVGFYVFVVGVIRPSEVPAFVRLTILVAVLAALGTIVEAATAKNLFFDVAGLVAPPGTRIQSGSTILTPAGRPDITGPARHGLAICTLLALVLPLAVVGAAQAEERRERLLLGAAALVILAGSLSTVRRSGVVLPFVSTSAVILLGGRKMLPIAITFVVLLVAAPVVAPGAVKDLSNQFSGTNQSAQQSIGGRTSDYSAVAPDVEHRLLLGRGFGSYAAQRYRFLDNQWLGLLISVGLVGTAAFAALTLASFGRSLASGLKRDGWPAWIGLAAAGSALAFILSNALFDALAFPQAPYAFLLVTALSLLGRQARDERRQVELARG